MTGFDFQLHTRIVYGPGALERLTRLATELGFSRTLVVSDPGLLAAGHVDQACRLLNAGGIQTFGFHDFQVNPDSAAVEAGRAFAAGLNIDSMVALGGGSSLDCAKGINFVLTNGGKIQDYWGHGKAVRPMLPMIGIPTTSGSGSEAQSYALISDSVTHRKMACGDPKAAFRVAILDPELALTQPASIAATTGLDAISHALESYVTSRSNPWSDLLAREAWRLLGSGFLRLLDHWPDREASQALLLGAHYAGLAIESSMLGAAHACANPLSARYGVTHGIAVALCLPHVVRWNAPFAASRYRDLLQIAGFRPSEQDGAELLARRLEEWIQISGLPERLGALPVPRQDLPLLAQEAASQWTAKFNPRPLDAEGALEIYQWAY